ncbi:MAG: ATP-binding protein [Campylobacterota bacterium]|nr:ATP-binding protein [Campylobacterota bacterium]
MWKLLLKNSIVVPILMIASLMVVGIITLIPYISDKGTIERETEKAKELVGYIRTFRSYYTDHVISKINSETDLHVNYDHKDHNNTVPLPATTLHDISELITQGSKGSIKMYSGYPFPNRSHRVLDSFEKHALSYLNKNPNQTYVKKETIDSKPVLRVALADIFYSPVCVECHNTRADTPKDDWKIGDVRGIIEVITPLQKQYSFNESIAEYVLYFILFNLLILFGTLMYLRHKELGKANDKLNNEVQKQTSELIQSNKILFEYKKAVDAGAIVSKTNSKGIITYVNDEFVRISGFSKSELIGNSHSMVRSPEVSNEVFKNLWQTIKAKKIWHGTIQNRTKDDESYYVQATIVPILDAKGEILEYLALRYDITPQIIALEQTKASERAKGTFLANMSHELRTPLNAIIGFSQILMMKPDTSDQVKSYIEKINISGNNLLGLVNTILDFSKIEAGKMEYNPSLCTLQSVISEAVLLTEPSAAKKSISIVTPDVEVDIFMDAQLIKQVLINLITNAIKFSDDNSQVDISYSYSEKAHSISVKDSGLGIDAELIPTLFDPFTQVEEHQKYAIKGTGLGLAIAKRIMDLHHGRIWIESEVGVGSIFYIELPIKA